MKKVLYVTTVSLTLNTFLIPHIRYLKEKGYDVQIASNIDVELSNIFNELGVNHTKIDFSRNPFSIKNVNAYKQIQRLQKEEKFDVIHVHTPVASFITRAAFKNENIKIIYTCHGFHFYDGAPLINWAIYYPIEKLAARWTDTLVTINKEDFNRAEKFRLRKNGQVKLMHGVGLESEKYYIKELDKSSYRKELGLKDDDFVILILAELNKNKNHIQLINAMKLLNYKYPRIKCLCAGDGPLKEKLEEKSKEFDLDKNIKFLGFRTDVKELINISNCVALFSKREGLGKCLLEGMMAGKPLLATNTRGPRELIENNKNGYLVKVGDYQKTAEYIKNIYLDTVKRNNFSKYSLSKIDKYYLENVLSDIEKYY